MFKGIALILHGSNILKQKKVHHNLYFALILHGSLKGTFLNIGGKEKISDPALRKSVSMNHENLAQFYAFSHEKTATPNI